MGKLPLASFDCFSFGFCFFFLFFSSFNYYLWQKIKAKEQAPQRLMRLYFCCWAVIKVAQGIFSSVGLPFLAKQSISLHRQNLLFSTLKTKNTFGSKWLEKIVSFELLKLAQTPTLRIPATAGGGRNPKIILFIFFFLFFLFDFFFSSYSYRSWVFWRAWSFFYLLVFCHFGAAFWCSLSSLRSFGVLSSL